MKNRRSSMRFGEGLQLRSSLHSNPLGATHPVILSTWADDAILEIGDDFAMTGGTICASKHIKIGNRVTIGANSVVVDTDFHPRDAKERIDNPEQGEMAPVVIEDDVFIGMSCLILKGVTIGRGSVIGAGSVVAKSVPAGSVAVGNPARVYSIDHSL